MIELSSSQNSLINEIKLNVILCIHSPSSIVNFSLRIFANFPIKMVSFEWEGRNYMLNSSFCNFLYFSHRQMSFH